MHFTQNYKEVTKVYPDNEKRGGSRSIIEPKKISPEGWGEMILLNEEGKMLDSYQKMKLNTADILKGFVYGKEDLTNKIVKIITNAINSLATSKKIEEFKPIEKSKYYLIDFGKIELWNGKFSLYPILIPNNTDMRKYQGGRFYAVAEESLLEPSLITFFYSQDPDKISPKFLFHQALYQLNKAKGKKTDEKEFMDNVQIVNPYGDDFILRLDLTKNTSKEIERSILDQINGTPEETTEIEKEAQPNNLEDSTRRKSSIQIAPGKKIGIIVPYISKDNFTEIEIKEILNLKEIQNASKFIRGLGDINYIEISWARKDGKLIKSKLERGSKIQWKKKGEIITGKIEEKGPMIVPNKEIIAQGSIPISVLR
jgi:hypothetical protein